VSNLLKRLMARHGAFLAVIAALLAGFEYLICAIVATVNVRGMLEELIKNLPPFARTLVEQQFFGGLGPAGILAFGWNHPITLALGTAVAIVLATRAVAGEIETGAVELVLSQPISRLRYFVAQVLFALLALSALIAVGACGTLLGQLVYGIHVLGAGTLFSIGLNYLLLQSAWFGITLVISVFGREAGRVAATGFVLALVSYVLQVIAQLWTKATPLHRYSVFGYYSPLDIVTRHHVPAKSAAVLLCLIIVAIALSAWRFLRRDIP